MIRKIRQDCESIYQHQSDISLAKLKLKAKRYDEYLLMGIECIALQDAYLALTECTTGESKL